MSKTTPSSLAIYQGLTQAGVSFAVSVPCVNLQELLTLVDKDPEILHIPVTREEEGIGLCAGAFLGGKQPAILMQNSGLGNSINALASLNSLYKIPVLMIISHRGCEGEPIVGQMPMGRLTKPLLQTMNIPYISPSPGEGKEAVVEAGKTAWKERRPTAVLLDLAYWRGL